VIRQWRELDRWIEVTASVAPAALHSSVPLRDLLTLRKEPVRPGTTLSPWQAITIRFTGEVVPRDRTTPFKGAMFAAYPGDLVFSKIDARNGAIGLVTSGAPQVVVTSEYPVFIPDQSRILPEFLKFLLRADHFKAELNARASGTSGRKRITADAFLSMNVPLPDLTEQANLTEEYEAAVGKADALQREAETLETEAWLRFENRLGLKYAAEVSAPFVFVANFSAIDRWSPQAIARKAALSSHVLGPAQTVPLRQVADVCYGIQKAPSNRPRHHPRPYLRVANVQRGYLELGDIRFIEVPDDDMNRLRLRAGDILLCEGNSPDLVGRGAIWRDEIPDCVHQNHVLRVRPDQSQLLSEFALAVINSSYGQAYFRSKAKRTTNLASINSTEVGQFPMPVPSPASQLAATAELDRSLAAAAALRATAATMRQNAWLHFEAALFVND
jgi:type I restriction enzyme, S subunit